MEAPISRRLISTTYRTNGATSASSVPSLYSFCSVSVFGVDQRSLSLRRGLVDSTLIAWWFHCAAYMLAAELVTEKKSKGEVLVFRRGHAPPQKLHDDPEYASNGEKMPAATRTGTQLDDGTVHIQKQTAIFHWQDVCYDIKIKSETRRILDHVDGCEHRSSLDQLCRHAS